MARPPAPPGPPPPHHRPPGTPPPSADPFGPLGRGAAPFGSSAHGSAAPAPSGLGPGAATALAVVMLLVGLIGGFFLGRAYDDGDDASVGTIDTADPSPTTTPPTGDTIPQEPPSPRDPPASPPATDLPPTSLGTPESPIPAGQAYVLGLYEIEVRGVDRDATDALADHDADNLAPPEGRRHVLVEVAVRFTDATGYGNPSSIPFFVSDGSGQWSGFDNGCGRLPRPLAAAGLIAQGDEAVGHVCFTVPDDAVDDLALGTESFSGPLWFALP